MIVKLTKGGKSIHISTDTIKHCEPFSGCVDYQIGNTLIVFNEFMGVYNEIWVDETIEEINKLLEAKR